MNQRILFFDGHCSLCNGFVDYLVRRDHSAQTKFASLQGETATRQLPAKLRDLADLETIVYLRDGVLLEKSGAVLTLLSDLGLRPLLLPSKWFLRVPARLRDHVYRFVAQNRYRFFGKRDTCRVPTPEEKDRFLP